MGYFRQMFREKEKIGRRRERVNERKHEKIKKNG